MTPRKPQWPKGVSGNPSGGKLGTLIPTRDQVLKRLWLVARKPDLCTTATVAALKALLDALPARAPTASAGDPFLTEPAKAEPEPLAAE